MVKSNFRLWFCLFFLFGLTACILPLKQLEQQPTPETSFTQLPSPQIEYDIRNQTFVELPLRHGSKIFKIDVDNEIITPFNLDQNKIIPMLAPNKSMLAFYGIPAEVYEQQILTNAGVDPLFLDIWVYDLLGNKARKISGKLAKRSALSWTYDSNYLVWVEDGNLQYYHIKSDQQKTVTLATFARPHPEKNQILIADLENRLSIVNIDNENSITVLIENPDFPNNAKIRDFDWWFDPNVLITLQAPLEENAYFFKYDVWLFDIANQSLKLFFEDAHDIRTSPEPNLLTALDGTSYFDVCSLDRGRKFIDVTDPTQPQKIKLEDFQFSPVLSNAPLIVPHSSNEVYWINQHQYIEYLSGYCSFNDGKGFYLVDINSKTATQLTFNDQYLPTHVSNVDEIRERYFINNGRYYSFLFVRPIHSQASYGDIYAYNVNEKIASPRILGKNLQLTEYGDEQLFYEVLPEDITKRNILSNWQDARYVLSDYSIVQNSIRLSNGRVIFTLDGQAMVWDEDTEKLSSLGIQGLKIIPKNNDEFTVQTSPHQLEHFYDTELHKTILDVSGWEDSPEIENFEYYESGSMQYFFRYPKRLGENNLSGCFVDYVVQNSFTFFEEPFNYQKCTHRVLDIYLNASSFLRPFQVTQVPEKPRENCRLSNTLEFFHNGIVVSPTIKRLSDIDLEPAFPGNLVEIQSSSVGDMFWLSDSVVALHLATPCIDVDKSTYNGWYLIAPAAGIGGMILSDAEIAALK